MSGRLAGKVAVVTGGTKGIGQGIVLRFLKEGACVAYCARSAAGNEDNEKLIADIRASSRALFLAADAANRNDMFALVDAAVKRFGGVDLVVNNAQTFTPFTPIEDAPDSHYQTHFGTGFYPCLWTSQAALPHMKAKGRGCIIHVSSARALWGMRYSADYNANKAAHENLARTMANEWGKFGITVNCVSPGAATPAYLAYKAAHPDAMLQLEAAIPMRRLADSEKDIAGTIIGLASDHCRFITGQNFYVDGGIWAVAPAH